MSHDDNSPTLQNLLDRANVIEANIHTAIADTDNAEVDVLSMQFDETVSAILAFSTTSLSELKHKCNFGQKLILPDHNDPVIVTDIFAKLVNDIESLDELFNTQSTSLRP